MKMPTRVCLDRQGNSYILDSPSSCILKFNPNGDFIEQIGRPGQGPGELSFPSLFLISGDSLVVDDVRNGRLQYLDLDGRFLRSYRTFEGYYSFAVSQEGHFYVAPRRLPYKEGPLIKEVSADGYLISSFGTRPLEPKDSTSFDGVTIDVNTKGEIFVAFRLLALVRRYSAAGQLICEYRLNQGMMGLREKFNLELRDSRKPPKDKRYFVVIESLKATEDGFYVLANGSPCLGILKYDNSGNLKKSYFWDEDWAYYARDFAVWNTGKDEVFYVVQISPDYCIDVLAKIH